MSEIKRPVITKEQAEAIQFLRSGGNDWTDGDILEHHASGKWSNEYAPLNNLGITTLAAALINGYEVEKTPEEKVREFYQRYDYDLRMYPAEMYFRAKEIQRIIKCTLNYLGVQVAGVNDEMGDEDDDDR
ncbi:DUF1642 domain-containing protein [Bacillus licheniformis]|uniref:DUF1642 domain-containing protein n=1 Tax=Bacillus licheniformis TaxID=1402 RepID=UPI002DBBA08B|nr:DUF1642 domain-containing protein [Bacillus licheniformis]MEC0477871.1 hypothetical protein [Bacillus licheniformis]